MRPGGVDASLLILTCGAESEVGKAGRAQNTVLKRCNVLWTHSSSLLGRAKRKPKMKARPKD